MRNKFLDGYKTYDPKVEGYGSSYQWKGRFYKRMGFEEAQEILGRKKSDPLQILGLDSNWTKEQLFKNFRELIMKHHPDRGGNKETAQRIIASFTVLKEQIGIK